MSKFVFVNRGELFARIVISKLNENGECVQVMSGFLAASSEGRTHDKFVSVVDMMVGNIYSDGQYIHIVNKFQIFDDRVEFHKDTVISSKYIRENYMVTYEILSRSEL